MSGRIFAALTAAALLAGCGSGGSQAAVSPAPQATFDTAGLPPGEPGDLIRYGRDIVNHTRALMQPYIVANMDCAACHVDAGLRPRGGSFVGIAAQFPQWNKRAKRTIALQDRLAECFLYSMNGKPPPYDSREMVALVSYITYLSRGTPIGAKPDPRTRLASISLGTPDLKHGSDLYAAKCSKCHLANGGGTSIYPPLWGPKSFNAGAGMHRVTTMAGFVRYNMPQDAPGTLTDREAYDVSAYVLGHARPKFQRNRLVAFPAQPAKFF
ncbi:MAG TPA: c-type cytochrome [Candidatus Baltobacteraceae bacterium]|nr:c-type cytochrome [Candidatus Baltobacteraceae bacterium]